ncbi:cystathionine beta-synthase [Phlebotomus argentipes]|uniref:cystathionine beta-synthase n=1 Tax=Phlebotomus argentipes TaxID=94469 RepID=UPI002892EA40|nr:cystathionine beta-synthase [Phlebotomus argentipes]
MPINGEEANDIYKVMPDFVRPDLPSRCTWSVGKDKTESPHSQWKFGERPKIMPNILHAIGHTPLVKLNNIPKAEGIECDMYVKCEFLNPGGSVKDRIGYRMVADAEEKGLLKPGCTIIEPTSGNTGIGLAMSCAVKGYKCLIVMPEKMSNEKVNALKALGAKIIRTPTEAGFDSPEGLIAVAQKLQKEIPDSIILDQYRNASNPVSHYDGTATEILHQMGGHVDMVVCGAGTGGTVCGIGRKMKEECPSCVVVAADPEGSILSLPEELNKSDVSFYEVEGIGYDFVPTVLDRSVVDLWMKSNDKECMPLARRLICEEGLLCGGSSGTALAVALKAAKKLKKGQKCVVILPDGVRNYMTKFISDNWLEARGLKEAKNVHNFWWWNTRVDGLKLNELVKVNITDMVQDVVQVLKKNNTEYAVIVDEKGILKGAATLGELMIKMGNFNLQAKDTIDRAVFKQFRKICKTTNLGLVSRILENDPFAVIVETMANTEKKCPHVETVWDLDPNFESPDTESRLWANAEPPSRPLKPELKKILPNILHAIGLTPVVKLNKIPQSLGIKCDMYAKCEFLNPGGSVKDRIGYRMVLDAEEKGLVKEGSTIIEPTSGNTGIGVALACAVKGYKCIIVMAEKNSNEKVDTLKILGAEIIRTPTEAGYLSPQGIFAVSQDLQKKIPNAVIMGQYSNPSNWLAHKEGTGSELLWQFDNDIDMIVAGAGTGGTVSGIGKAMKEGCPKCKIVSFDPEGSILARPESLNKSDVSFFEVEGIGYDFIPTVLKHEHVDEWYKSNDSDAFPMARRLIAEEGLLCGGSSGSAMSVALKAAKNLQAGQKCVVILPDGIRNYMTKFVSDNWMQVRGFLPLENTHEHWWWSNHVDEVPTNDLITLKSNQTCQEAINVLKEQGLDQLPVVSDEDYLLGMVTLETLIVKLGAGVAKDDPVAKALNKTFRRVTYETNLGLLSSILEKEPFVIVTRAVPVQCSKPKEVVEKIITRSEFLAYISNHDNDRNKLE